ncbi:MAG: CHAD domain-containing protein [Bryobacteraceae bacterium]
MKRFLRKQTSRRVESLREALASFEAAPHDAIALHDLRVAARRVQQCQRLFGGPSRKLRRIMDLSSAVRNGDVTLELLASAKVLTAKLKQQIQTQREAALHDLTAQLKHLRKLKVAHNKNFRRRDVLRMIAQWFDSGDAASQDGAASLHRFRLLGKRLRYTLELFPGTDALVDQLRSVQDRLGAIQDCAAALPMLEGHPRAIAVISKLQSTRERAFRNFWKRTLAKKADQWKSTFSATAKPKTEPPVAATPTAN